MTKADMEIEGLPGSWLTARVVGEEEFDTTEETYVQNIEVTVTVPSDLGYFESTQILSVDFERPGW